MKLRFFPLLPWLLLFGTATLPVHAPAQEAATPAPGAKGKPITEVAHFQEYQVTGIAVSKTGRLFANFPRWTNDYKYAVAEVAPDSSLTPFPDETWNSWKDKDPDVGNKFVCVQSVTVDDTGALWVLDTGNPGMNGTLPGAPKLVKIDLATNKVVQTIPFGADICPAKSYLNDVRFDTARQVAYLTESGVGCIVVVDLKSGKARRTLVEDESTLYDKNVDLTINGKEVETRRKAEAEVQRGRHRAFARQRVSLLSGDIERHALPHRHRQAARRKHQQGGTEQGGGKGRRELPVRRLLDGQGRVTSI